MPQAKLRDEWRRGRNSVQQVYRGQMRVHAELDSMLKVGKCIQKVLTGHQEDFENILISLKVLGSFSSFQFPNMAIVVPLKLKYLRAFV